MNLWVVGVVINISVVLLLWFWLWPGLSQAGTHDHTAWKRHWLLPISALFSHLTIYGAATTTTTMTQVVRTFSIVVVVVAAVNYLNSTLNYCNSHKLYGTVTPHRDMASATLELSSFPADSSGSTYDNQRGGKGSIRRDDKGFFFVVRYPWSMISIIRRMLLLPFCMSFLMAARQSQNVNPSEH